jgi:hypothetical protein
MKAVLMVFLLAVLRASVTADLMVDTMAVMSVE